MSQISAQYCDGLEVRIKELQAENAALKAEVEQWQKSVCEQGEVIEALKAELVEYQAKRDVAVSTLELAKPAEPDFCDTHCTWLDHHPDCERAEPVAQEPVAWRITRRLANDPYNKLPFVVQVEPMEVQPGTLVEPLYLAPPDQSAEVSMTPAASIFKDEVARLNAEVERLREILSAQVSQAESQQTVYRNRIAELERQQAVLVEALEEARDEVVGWAAYASEYFQQKHNLKGYVEKLDATLASVKGNAEVTGVTTGENDAT